MNDRNILHIITHYSPHVYGAENFAQHLAEHQAKKNEVTVVTGRWKTAWKKQEIIHAVKVIRVPMLKIRYLQTILATIPLVFTSWRIITKQHIKILHTHIFPGLLVGALLRTFHPGFLARKYHVQSNNKQMTVLRWIATIQGGDIGDYPEVFGPAPIRWLFQKCIGWALQQADIVHCVSTYLKDEVIKLGVDPKKVIIVPNGVDIQQFTINNAQLGNKWSTAVVPSLHKEGQAEIRGGLRLRFISTSRLEDKNNLPFLIDVFHALTKKGYTISLDIFGTGSQEQTLRSKISRLKSQSYIRLKGYIDNDKLATILPEYHFFIRLSKQEGFGISFIEAMACGVIPIGTPVGGIVDIIEDRKTGYLINIPKNKIKTRNTLPSTVIPDRQRSAPRSGIQKIVLQVEQILQGKKTWKNVADQARSQATERYSWEKILSHFNRGGIR